MSNLRRLFRSCFMPVALLLCTATPALMGQTALINSIGNPTSLPWYDVTPGIGVAFRTGPDNHFNLHSYVGYFATVDINFDSVSATIHSANGDGTIGAALSTCGVPVIIEGTVAGSCKVEFHPVSTVTLQPDTTYWFVIDDLASTSTMGATTTLTYSAVLGATIPAVKSNAVFDGAAWIYYDLTLHIYKFIINYDAATVVSLNSFTAQAQANQVNLAWSTGSEVDTAGFNVWRAAEANGTFVKATTALIPAMGINVNGASYTWTDTNVSAGQTWFYKLEDIDTQGISTFHGPVSATVGAVSSILSFQATPPSIFLGGSSLLHWTVNGTPALAISGIGSVSGSSVSVAPVATTSYTLTDGQATSLATVTVRPFVLKDLPGLSKAWGSAKGQAAFDPCYDLNGDGKVDDADVALCLK